MDHLQLGFIWILLAIADVSELSYIFPTSENPSRSYTVGEHFSLRVRYTSSQFIKTEWEFVPTFKWGDGEGGLIQSRKRVKADDSVVEIVERDASLSDSGLYTFRMLKYEQVIEETNFTVSVNMIPTVVLVHREEDVYKQNLKVDKTYEFHCWANCNGQPDFTWEFSRCADFTRQMGCKDDWQPLTGNWSSAKIEQNPTVDQEYSYNPFYHGVKLILSVNQVGSLRCGATNTEGKGSSEAQDLIPSDLPDYKSNPEMFVSPHKCAMAQLDDSLNLTCQARIYRDGLDWDWPGKIFAYQHMRMEFSRRRSNYSYYGIMLLANIEEEDAGTYTCESSYKGTTVTQSVALVIKDRLQHIQQSHHDNTYVSFDKGEEVQLKCKEPSRTFWYRNRVQINITDGKYKRTPNGLQIANTSTSDEGEYICLFDVIKRNGECDYDLRTFVLSQRATESYFRRNLTPIIATSAVVCGCLIVALVVILARMAVVNSRSNRALRQLEKELQQNEFDPTLPVFAMLENGPVMKPNYPYHLKVDRLIIDRHNVVRLGEGNFGVVLQVGLKMPDGSVERVALKRPKNNFDANQYRMLHMEICLMTYLGKHPNIVNMIGCVTNISHGQLYMVMELCTEGSLEDLLKSVRADLSTKFCSELHNPYQNVSDGKRYVQEDFPNWASIKADMKGFTFHSDLLSYAYQIASAMEYLSSINYIHRDLAARNVLLCHNYKIAKVADFGLGHRIYQENYKIVDKRKSLMMPVRWTAPESLIYREFSSSSDVWSFGILIGEIFSLGELPFAHVAHFDPKKVLSGEVKPNRPKLASDSIYQLMLNCCKPDKKDRVSFGEAKVHLSDELNRCSPEEMAKLLAQLDRLQQQICSSSEPTGTSIFYSNQPHSGSKRSLVVTFYDDTVSSHVSL